MSHAGGYWYAFVAIGGLAFGLSGERRPFGDDVLAHPFVIYFLLVGIGLVVLRIVRGKPVPQLLPERTLALGCAAGILCFLVGNFVAVRLVGI